MAAVLAANIVVALFAHTRVSWIMVALVAITLALILWRPPHRGG